MRATAGVVFSARIHHACRLPERAHTAEAAGWLRHRHDDGQGADDLHVEGEEVTQEEEEQLQGQQHRARVVSEEEGNIKLNNQDGSPARNGMEDVAEQRGTERALQAVAAGQQLPYKPVERGRPRLAGTRYDRS